MSLSNIDRLGERGGAGGISFRISYRLGQGILNYKKDNIVTGLRERRG